MRLSKVRRFGRAIGARGFAAGAEESGAAVAEFALVMPVLGAILYGILSVGIVMNNDEMLTGAVSVGARQLALARGSSTPYATTSALVLQAAQGLDPNRVTVTLSVNGQPCTSDAGDSACSNLLTPGAPESVTASYPCSIVIMGVDYAPNCVLTQTLTGRVE